MTNVYELLLEWWHIAIPITISGIELLGLLSAWHAALRVRTSQAAVAWAVSLAAAPMVTLPLYWIFGRNRFGGYRAAIRQVAAQHKSSVDAVRRELLTARNVPSRFPASPLTRLADVLDTPLSVGNRFELLIDGQKFFDELIRQIESAEHYVYAQFYIIRADEVGQIFADALWGRAQAGAVVRLLYDELGCISLPRAYLQRLRQAGVEVQSFNTQQGWTNRFQLNFRNHRKLLVVDGQRAVVCGLNIGNEYLGKLAWAKGWRDTALSMVGPVAKKLQAAFATDYYWATRRDLPEAQWSDDRLPHSRAQSLDAIEDGAVVCATGPADVRNRATMMFADVASTAQQRLWISTPYLVPDDACMTALSMARARGVDVRLLIPSQPDQWVVYLAGFYYEQQLEAIGVAVYRYQPGFLHQKCVLADDQIVLIGSTNLDNRSLHLNFELMVAANEPALIEQAAQMFQADFAAAQLTNDRQNRLIPWYIRVGTVIARLFSPVL